MNNTFRSADILLPKTGVDPYKWSVVACDQYTSEPEYWEKVNEIVGDAPSTYKLTLPEVYLNDPDVEERLARIGKTMEEYLAADIFTEYKDAMIYVERTDSTGKVRAGIVGAIDLEQYDYHKGSTSLVRATETTVIERIPPRIKVRKSAKIELPHIMILIDDREKTVVEPLADADLPVLYDFDMMQGGGHLKGFLLDAGAQEKVQQALAALGDPQHFNDLYGLKDTPVLLYAMGDGNHSLATAKEFYEQLKAANPGKDLSSHPARYALVEIVNLHSEALEFEAIHRIVEEIDVPAMMAEMTVALGLVRDERMDLGKKSQEDLAYILGEGVQQLVVVDHGHKTAYTITKPTSKLTVGSLQGFLDEYLKKNGGKIDYIHGEEGIMTLARKENSVGFLLPDMGKEELFPTVIADGALPRKTFSMGHAQDKRFYMEARKITEE